MRRSMRTAATALIAIAAAGFLGLPPAQAAGSPGWHLAKTFGASYGSPQLTGGVAVSIGDAWVEGYLYQFQNGLFLVHWNGSRWSQVAVPKVVASVSAGSVSPGPMVASAERLWTFPTIFASQNHVYAARLAAGHWTTWQLRGALRIDGAAVFGASDVWAFGEALLPKGWHGLANGPSYAEHFNGRQWAPVKLPGVPLIVQPVARNNIWAFGPTNRTAQAENQQFIAMHWNGSRWSTLQVPRLRAVNGKLMWPDSFAVSGGSRLWVTEEFHCPTPGVCSPPQPPGIILAYWSGRRWVTVLDTLRYQLPGAESDGHGGLWITVVTASNPSVVFLHYANGRFTKSRLPAVAGESYSNVSSPIPIPGTTSAWATAAISPASGLSTGEVFRYVP